MPRQRAGRRGRHGAGRAGRLRAAGSRPGRAVPWQRLLPIALALWGCSNPSVRWVTGATVLEGTAATEYTLAMQGEAPQLTAVAQAVPIPMGGLPALGLGACLNSVRWARAGTHEVVVVWWAARTDSSVVLRLAHSRDNGAHWDSLSLGNHTRSGDTGLRPATARSRTRCAARVRTSGVLVRARGRGWRLLPAGDGPGGRARHSGTRKRATRRSDACVAPRRRTACTGAGRYVVNVSCPSGNRLRRGTRRDERGRAWRHGRGSLPGSQWARTTHCPCAFRDSRTRLRRATGGLWQWHCCIAAGRRHRRESPRSGVDRRRARARKHPAQRNAARGSAGLRLGVMR